MSSLHWATKSVITIFMFVPFFIAMAYFSRNYQVRPEAFTIWYLAGVVISTPFLLCGLGLASVDDFAPTFPLFIALIMGVTLGAVGNIIFPQAIVAAPNPSYPLAIYNAAPVVMFAALLLLRYFIPQHFGAIHYDKLHFAGILLVIGGSALILQP